MPARRKNKFQKQNTKESQVIRTRLIEISLKLDGIIYQKEPISQSEAEVFIREVISYKTKCFEDERSLQVIEKIVRCMKSIIAELQETRIDDCNTYDEDLYLNVGAASPVYSLEDDDRTQLTQEAIKNQRSTDTEKVNTMTAGNIDFIDYDYDKTQFTQIEQIKTVSNNEETHTEDITISDDDADYSIPATESTNIVTRPTLYSDSEMHRALSNLSLKDVSQENVAYTNAECSQSILYNFHDIDKLEQVTSLNVHSDDRRLVNKKPNEIEINLHDQNIKEHNEKPQIFGLRTVSHVITATASNLKVPESYNNKTNANTLREQQPLKTAMCLNNTVVKSADKAIISALKTNKEKAKIVTKKTINEIQQNFSPITYSTNIKRNKHNTNNKITVQGKINNENAAIVKKKRAPRKKKEIKANDTKIAKKDNDLNEKDNNDVNNIKPAPKRNNTKITNRIVKDCPVPIYNKNVENDLSWMENIRFVREIQDDEYDRKLAGLEENFWNNYQLPPNFDESDFL